MWSNFQQSLLEDETISNAFSSRGVFKIRSDELVEQYPRVQASVYNKKIIIAIDKTLVLIDDETILKCSNLSFNANIDVIAISQSGHLVIVGLSDGAIHGIFIKGIPLFNLCIKAEDISLTGHSFSGIQQIGQRFYFICSNGSVYHLSEIDEQPLEANMNISINENETAPFDESILAHVTIEQGCTGRILNDLTAAVLLSQSNNCDEDIALYPQFIASSGNILYFHGPQSKPIKVSLRSHYEGVKRIYNLENFILILTESGHLMQVCPLTKTIMLPSSESYPNFKIDEMIIMECSDENIELLILTKATSNEERLLKIIEYPSFKCHSELEVTNHSWLVQQPKCSVNLYYLSGHTESVATEIPNEIEMTLISETHPSERFKKLIAKGHLEEAEEFGIQFELCLQPIYEAKAKRILIELTALEDNNPELAATRFEVLLGLMAQIESKIFFKNNRLIVMPSRKILRIYLEFILPKLDEEEDEYDYLEIIEQLHRLETLTIIDPYECNIDWQKFVYHPNLVKMVMTLFKSDIPTACLIWKRHSCAMIPQLKESELCKMLNLIPNNTEAFNIIQWLHQFVPSVSNAHPNMMPYITEWSIEKTRSLQYAKDWPEIGLEFCTKVSDIFEELQYMHSDVRRQHERNIAKLVDLRNALQDLSVLKKCYNLTLTLDNYLKDSMDETALCILQHVHLDNLKSLVNDFLYPIYQEKGKSPVSAISHYISLLVANRNLLSTWLKRAVLCIELLHIEDDRLESSLLVLQNSPVPWPDTVLPLVKLRYSTHPLAVKINTEYEIQVIKIMKVKYGWPADSASDINLQLFMFRIVKMNLPDMLKDIRILTKAAPEIARIANFNCCYQLVRQGKLEVAYDFFKSLETEKDPSINQVIELFSDLLENSLPQSDDESIEEYKNLMEFHKLITPRNCEASQKRLLVIQSRFTLKYKFNLHVQDISELISLNNRRKWLDLGIENIIERSQATKNVSNFISNEIGELCNALRLHKMIGICHISSRVRCLTLTCALAYSLLNSIDFSAANKDDAINLSLEILAQQLLCTKKNNQTSGFLHCKELDPLAFLLAYEFLSGALMYEQNQRRELIELMKYINVVRHVYPIDSIETYYNGHATKINEEICRALDASEIIVAEATLNFSTFNNSIQEVKPVKQRYSVSIFDEVDVKQEQPTQKIGYNDKFPIVKFVSRTLMLMISEVEPTNYLLNKLRNLIPNDIKEDLNGSRNDFFNSLEQMIKVKLHDVWYITAQFIIEFQKHNNCNILNEDFISLQLTRVFRNILTHKHVNFIDLFVMLIADNHTETLLNKLSLDLKTDQQKINLLTLSEMYSSHLSDKENLETIRMKRMKFYYYMQFCKQDPNIKAKFNMDIDNVEQLLKEFHNKKLDVNLLERMSRDFNLDYQHMLITQVIRILQSQEMQYDIQMDAFEEEELVMTTKTEHIRDLCQPYINEIKNTELLVSRLKLFIDDINIYFYELYLCVIEILSYFEALPPNMHIWTSILHFLKHKMVKRRHNRPGQFEIDVWLQSQSEIGVLPKIARYRLPFKPIVEQPLKDILDNELSVDNCETWFPLIQMHTVLKGSKEVEKMRDYFCMSVVKSSIIEYKSQNDVETWHLQPKNDAFLKSILRLVTHIHSPSKAFMILYFVSNYAPDGADQVEASYAAYKFAIENESKIVDQQVQSQLARIKRKYPTLKTQHLLYIYGLTDEKLMRLVESPKELIHSLYHHEIILKSSKLDINTVVNEISQLHNLNVEEIQFQLLLKWLTFTMETTDGTVLEETFTEDHNASQNFGDDAGSAAENVIRANYILKSWPKKNAVQFLVGHIFTFDSNTGNTSNQLQMYECFSKLNDGSASFNNTLSQKEYITLKCVHDLKQLGYNTSIEKFSNCNKIDILKTIWQRNAQNPRTLEILANICLGFDIYLSRIWNGILKRMALFNMLHELNALVDVLSNQPKMLNTEGLTIAWEFVLKQPFKNANQTRSFAQEEVLHKTLFRLQSCPIAHKLNHIEFAELCIVLERPHMAVILLSFCPNAERRQEIKKLIEKHKTNKMRDEILELEDAGILPVILSFALKELEL